MCGTVHSGVRGYKGVPQGVLGTGGYHKMENISKIGLGTHLGSFSDEDSRQYEEGVAFAVRNGITGIDTAINYRGMRSEKDIGKAIGALLASGEVHREDIFLATKAGLLFGDVTSGLNPMRYLQEVLAPKGICMQDFGAYEGLYQTINPDFYEIALQISLQNLGVDTVDVHYIHIPEITRAQLTEDTFYKRLAQLIAWYEEKVKEGKIRFYGLAFEMLAMEPEEEKWYINIEKVGQIAREIEGGDCHFKYIQIPYNRKYPYAATVRNQPFQGEDCTLVEAAHRMGMQVVGSMPLDCGEGFGKYTLEEMISYALNGVDAINVGSRNVGHIREIASLLGTILD